MPQYKVGNYLTRDFVADHPNDIFLFTGNNIVKRDRRKIFESDHKLVMGAGAAKAFLECFPYSDVLFADRISLVKRYYCYLVKYTPSVSPYNSIYKIGIFQTKEDFRDPSSIDIIQKSTETLQVLAESNTDYMFHLNYPGIGLGGLSKEQVEPIIKNLPDNVIIWSLQ